MLSMSGAVSVNPPPICLHDMNSDNFTFDLSDTLTYAPNSVSLRKHIHITYKQCVQFCRLTGILGIISQALRCSRGECL